MGDYIGVAVFWSPLYMVPAAIGIVPALVTLRERGERTFLPDWATLYLPFLVWIVFAASLNRPKSLGNVLEVPMLGLSVAVTALFRNLAAGGRRDRLVSWLFLLLACAIAAAVAMFTPLLPE